MSDGDDDAWVSLGAIAAQVMEKMAAPAPREDETGAGTQAAGRQGRAQHNGPAGGGGGAVVIQLFGGDGRVTSRPRGMRTNRTREHTTTGVVTDLTCALAKRPARIRR